MAKIASNDSSHMTILKREQFIFVNIKQFSLLHLFYVIFTFFIENKNYGVYLSVQTIKILTGFTSELLYLY